MYVGENTNIELESGLFLRTPIHRVDSKGSYTADNNLIIQFPTYFFCKKCVLKTLQLRHAVICHTLWQI